MACDLRLKPRQTIQDRAREVRAAMERIKVRLSQGQARIKVSPTGAVAFDGIPESERDGVSDACAFRRLMAEGSWEVRQAVARAEAAAGRTVDRAVVGQGTHSHDGGRTWHPGH